MRFGLFSINERLIPMPPAALDADGLERYVETVGKELVGAWGS